MTPEEMFKQGELLSRIPEFPLCIYCGNEVTPESASRDDRYAARTHRTCREAAITRRVAHEDEEARARWAVVDADDAPAGR